MIEITPNSRVFYDPVYEIHLSGVLIGANIFNEEKKKLAGLLLEVMDTSEFSRLNYVKQEGLSYLVYPSATYTLFERSVGNVILGMRSIRGINKKNDNGKYGPNLEELLDNSGLLDEFLLALLLKNVGRSPFYDVLNRNEMFKDYNPDRAAIDIIRGEGDRTESIWYEECRTVNDVLKNWDNLDVDALCYLIDGDDGVISGSHKDELDIYRDVISGLFDLDKIDRGMRISYNTGQKFAIFNIGQFFKNVYLDSENQFRVENDGIKYVHSLLISKDTNFSAIFDNSALICYNAMLDYCVSKYLEDMDDGSGKEFMFLSDDEALHRLGSADKPVSDMLRRILDRRHYELVKRGRMRDDIDIKSVIDDSIRSSSYNGSDLLVYAPEFGFFGNEGWMDFVSEDGEKVLGREADEKLMSFHYKKIEEWQNKAYFFVPEKRTGRDENQVLKNIVDSVFEVEV